MNTNPKSSPQVLKLYCIQGLSKNVSKLILCANMLKSYNLVLHKFSDEVMSDINMLSPAMLNRIFGNINSTQIVQNNVITSCVTLYSDNICFIHTS